MTKRPKSPVSAQDLTKRLRKSVFAPALNDKYTLPPECQILGKGSYGKVFRIKKKQGKLGQEYVALKVAEIESTDDHLMFQREVCLLQQLSPHPNIVSLEHYTLYNKTFYLVFEMMSTDLNKFIYPSSSDKRWYLSDVAIQFLYREIMQGIEYLHSKGVIHRDLKPANILIDINPETCEFSAIKIADFGLSTVLPDIEKEEAANYPRVERQMSVVVYSYWYRPPEIYMNDEEKTTLYGCSADMWAAGCILAEVLNCSASMFSIEDRRLKQLFRSPEKYMLDCICLLDKVKNESRISVSPPGIIPCKDCCTNYGGWTWSDSSKLGADLLSQLVCLAPRSRLTAKEALAHPFLSQ